MLNKRQIYFDVLKGLAIIAVVLYHLGVCKYGYLGVDVFLVLAGYFTMSSIEKRLYNNRRGYVDFIINKVFRLLPLLLIAEAVSLLFGILFMLPDDLENLGQSVVATNFFSNNILQCITTKNYWDVANEYKPLMHTWYVGLIMQFYCIVPLIYFAIGKILKYNIKLLAWVNVLIGAISLLLYLFVGTTAEHFYYLPFRLYEFCAGASIYHLSTFNNSQNRKWLIQPIAFIANVLLIILLFINKQFASNVIRLVATVFLTSFMVYIMPLCKMQTNKLFLTKMLALLGLGSYSIFVWHQVIIAFVRYSFTNNLYQVQVIAILLIIILVLSFLSFKFIERITINKFMIMIFSLIFISTTGVSLYIYKHAGVIRDVPELEVMKGDERRGMWAEYCDRGYQFDKNFSSNGTPHWFVIGNSFGRDWVNIISESKIADKVEVSYTDDVALNKDHSERFSNADIIFISTLGLNQELIEKVKDKCNENCKVYVIGEKNFGECNGQVYRQRFSKDYYQMTVAIGQDYLEKNIALKSLYPDTYIDMIDLVSSGDGKVRVFTDNGCFISQDCRHLTKSGAEYYATLIDWDKFISL